MIGVAIVASIGAAAVPQGGVIMAALVMSSTGAPDDAIRAGVAALLALEWFSQRLRTGIGVFGDAVAAGLVTQTIQHGFPHRPRTQHRPYERSHAVATTGETYAQQGAARSGERTDRRPSYDDRPRRDDQRRGEGSDSRGPRMRREGRDSRDSRDGRDDRHRGGRGREGGGMRGRDYPPRGRRPYQGSSDRPPASVPQEETPVESYREVAPEIETPSFRGDFSLRAEDMPDTDFEKQYDRPTPERDIQGDEPAEQATPSAKGPAWGLSKEEEPFSDLAPTTTPHPDDPHDPASGGFGRGRRRKHQG